MTGRCSALCLFWFIWFAYIFFFSAHRSIFVLSVHFQGNSSSRSLRLWSFVFSFLNRGDCARWAQRARPSDSATDVLWSSHVLALRLWIARLQMTKDTQLAPASSSSAKHMFENINGIVLRLLCECLMIVPSIFLRLLSRLFPRSWKSELLMMVFCSPSIHATLGNKEPLIY